MTEQLFIEKENGQLEINFESLELITNEEFVYNVKLALDLRYRIVELNSYAGYVEVYMLSETGFVKHLAWVQDGERSIVQTKTVSPTVIKTMYKYAKQGSAF